MKRQVLAPFAIVVGLTVAGVSAFAWVDDLTTSTAGPGDSARSTGGHGKHHSHHHHAKQHGKHSGKQHGKQPGKQHAKKPPHRRPHVTHVRVRPGAPERLRLPSLGVSAPVFPIGSPDSRTLIPPSDYTTVGWWSVGAKPGEGHGTTIIAGHTVHTGGGALDNLGAVERGDRIRLDRARQDVRYTVTSVRTYRKGALAQRAGKVFDQLGPERLAVVTCGDWNGELYLSNVVVIAENPRPVPAGR